MCVELSYNEWVIDQKTYDNKWIEKGMNTPSMSMVI